VITSYCIAKLTCFFEVAAAQRLTPLRWYQSLAVIRFILAPRWKVYTPTYKTGS